MSSCFIFSSSAQAPLRFAGSSAKILFTALLQVGGDGDEYSNSSNGHISCDTIPVSSIVQGRRDSPRRRSHFCGDRSGGWLQGRENRTDHHRIHWQRRDGWRQGRDSERLRGQAVREQRAGFGTAFDARKTLFAI